MTDTIWLQASLPFILAGLGIRKVVDSSIPAYFSYQSQELSHRILNKFEIDQEQIKL